MISDGPAKVGDVEIAPGLAGRKRLHRLLRPTRYSLGVPFLNELLVDVGGAARPRPPRALFATE
eukprot:7684754-Pyramimonas_sp.AAC.1